MMNKTDITIKYYHKMLYSKTCTCHQLIMLLVPCINLTSAFQMRFSVQLSASQTDRNAKPLIRFAGWRLQ